MSGLPPQVPWRRFVAVLRKLGYTPKLVLMFSAIEALAKTDGGNKDWKKLEEILGKDLLNEVYKRNDGLRHRLAHGEYFNSIDPGRNYVHIIHGKVMAYFNRSILGDSLLEEGTVDPQRHFFGNKEEVRSFIKPKTTRAKLVLKDVLHDFDQNGIYELTQYEPVFDKVLEFGY